MRRVTSPTPQYPPPPEQTYHLGQMMPPPVAPGRPPRSKAPMLIGIAAAVLVLAIGAAIIVSATGIAPVGTPLVGKDSGIAACESIGQDDKLAGTNDNSDDKLTPEEYREVRALFSESKHEAIRTNGTKLVDIVWQIAQLPEDAGLAALPMLGTLTEAYAGLAGGCAEQGIIIPPMQTSGT